MLVINCVPYIRQLSCSRYLARKKLTLPYRRIVIALFRTAGVYSKMVVVDSTEASPGLFTWNDVFVCHGQPQPDTEETMLRTSMIPDTLIVPTSSLGFQIHSKILNGTERKKDRLHTSPCRYRIKKVTRHLLQNHNCRNVLCKRARPHQSMTGTN